MTAIKERSQVSELDVVGERIKVIIRERKGFVLGDKSETLSIFNCTAF